LSCGRENVTTATCRGCGCQLQGEPYSRGKDAYLPNGERAKVNHYGGFVCSRQCDFSSSLRLEQSMPGHGHEQASLSSYAAQSLRDNWDGDVA
jgi:hypothetical protein